MSAEEERMLQLVGDFREGKITRQAAATLGQVSTRTISRKTAKVRKGGPAAIRHGNRHRSPFNRLAVTAEQEAMDLMKSRYFDFNMQHAWEVLCREHGLRASYDTFVRWCHRHKVGRRKKRRPSKSRISRERMACSGMMMQMDGSTHEWILGVKWCLIGGIDDATSISPDCQFFESEDTFGTFAVLRRTVEQYGIPLSVYVDRGKAFGGLRDEEENQFRRLCGELGITVINALSPQAKGRIERMWRTFQDRLIPELRLAKITTMKDANMYLREVFLPKYWNCEKTVTPSVGETRYRPVPQGLNLDEVFCKKYRRRIRTSQLFDFRGATYQLKSPVVGSIVGGELVIHEYPDNSWSAFYGSCRVKITPMGQNRRRFPLLKVS